MMASSLLCLDDFEFRWNMLDFPRIPKHLKYFGGVYFMFCAPIRKIYIGSSFSFRKKYSEHLSRMRDLKHNSIMNNVVKKYGIGSFVFGILKVCEESELMHSEQYFIDLFNANLQLNMNPMATCATGIIRSPEVRKKMSLGKIGKKQSAKTIELKKIIFSGSGNPMYNKAHSEETKEIISKKAKDRFKNDPESFSNGMRKLYEWSKTQVHTDERRIKMSNKFRGEGGPSSKLKELDVLKIIELINSGMSNSAVAKLFGVCFQNISFIRNGKSWKYLNHLIDNKYKNLKSTPIEVYQYDRFGNLIGVYPSVGGASKKTGVLREYISRCCKGVDGIRFSFGFVWSYIRLELGYFDNLKIRKTKY